MKTVYGSKKKHKGESSGYPAKSWGGSLIRTNGEARASYYILKSYWKKEPMVHFSVMVYIALCLGYFICWLWNKGMPIKAGWVMVAFYGLSPFFACNSIAMWKDPIFSATICVWTLVIFDFVLSEGAVFNRNFLIKICG